MENIETKLEKYSTPYVNGEVRSNEYDHQIKLQSKLKHRMLLVDQIALESKYLLLTHSQKDTVKFLVRTFNNNFKDLHRQASDETIILAFMFYLKKLETPKIQLKNYRITQKYRLTDTIFELILCRVTDYFMTTSPLCIQESLRDNHDEIIRTGDYS